MSQNFSFSRRVTYSIKDLLRNNKLQKIMDNSLDACHHGWAEGCSPFENVLFGCPLLHCPHCFAEGIELELSLLQVNWREFQPIFFDFPKFSFVFRNYFSFGLGSRVFSTCPLSIVKSLVKSQDPGQQ